MTEQADIVIPSSADDRKKISDAVQEGCDAMLRMDAERDLIKDILETVEEKYKIPRKHVRKMMRHKHAGTFDKEAKESEDFCALYETIIGG